MRNLQKDEKPLLNEKCSKSDWI